MDKIIIFGCGPTGLYTYEQMKNKSEVIAFLDNDKSKTGKKIGNVSVLYPDEKLLKELNYDYIVIASVYGDREIKAQLSEMGVSDKQMMDWPDTPNILPSFLKCLSEDFEDESISGSCAEVGVFRGENAGQINKYFPRRRLHLYDTFEGFSPNDIVIEQKFGRKDAKAGQFSDTSVEVVMERMEHPEKVIIHKGYFPDTAKGLDEEFCFVRIDLDLYAPTEAALELFTPLMGRGGVILVHDYFGTQYPGIKKVVREFLLRHRNLYKIPIGDDMSIAIAGF